MQSRQPAEPGAAPTLSLGDVYHVLFRHKRKIILIWAIGFAATMALWLAWPTKFQSEAELFVRYVPHIRSLTTLTGDSDIQTIDQGGQGIINAEVKILGSFDLALAVADAIGPSNVLAKAGGGTNREAAAAVIKDSLMVDPANNSAVIRLVFKHKDEKLVRPLLNEYITSYQKTHNDIYQSAGPQYKFLIEQVEQIKSLLTQTEDELRNAKTLAGVTSPEDSKHTCIERIASIQSDLSNAEADLAEQQAALNEPAKPSSTSIETNTSSRLLAPPDKLAEYRRVCGLLERLEQQERELLVQYNTESSPVKAIRAQIGENQKARNLLEKEFPQLASVHAVEAGTTTQPAISRAESTNERIRSLEARIAQRKRQLDEVKSELAKIDNQEGKITELQRKKELQERKLRLLSESVEKAHIDETVGEGRISNIGVIQYPCPPFKDMKKAKKMLLLLLFGTFAGGIGFAFVLEMYLDRSFKRPSEIEPKLGLPLFLSIPLTSFNGKNPIAPKPSSLFSWSPKTSPGDAPSSNQTELVNFKPSHLLQPFFESLRDRLIMFFELKNMTHNPKLVAVTSCGEKAGVTTIASGLAASLSEIGEGNVLLVDMNRESGSAHYFHRGTLACSLDEALDKSEKRNDAQVKDKLYVVAETAEDQKLPRILHKRFSTLMPKLRASDFDYIIFDMPPVSQISPTTKVARFMDIVLMVVESEKTDRDAVKQASALLAESKANVGVVLNKNRTYVPRQLLHEL